MIARGSCRKDGFSKGDIASALACASQKVSQKEASKLLDRLATLLASRLKETGVFTVPGMGTFKICTKKATKARMVMGKAKPACKILHFQMSRSLKAKFEKVLK